MKYKFSNLELNSNPQLDRKIKAATVGTKLFQLLFTDENDYNSFDDYVADICETLHKWIGKYLMLCMEEVHDCKQNFEMLDYFTALYDRLYWGSFKVANNHIVVNPYKSRYKYNAILRKYMNLDVLLSE